MNEVKANVFNIQRFCVHDGPGIRTAVFFKGCPLRCLWCSNPESLSGDPELGFSAVSCDGCGRCAPACRQGAITLAENGRPKIDRRRCTACGDCVQVCLPEALAIYGQQMTVDEVFAEVCKDASYYRGSNGGITVSGGEPLHQLSFVVALFQRCRDAGIHTAVETSGFVAKAQFQNVLPLVDYFLFDLKHLDGGEHRRLTGQPNDLILENARTVVDRGIQVLFRLPLIPGLNDTGDNIAATSRFLRELQGDASAIELMPYHRLGVGKYGALGRAYPLEGLPPLQPEAVERIRNCYEEHGVRCLVSQ